MKTAEHKILPSSAFIQKILSGVLLLACLQLFIYAFVSLFMIIQWLF
jgi:hypothetical protein